MKSQRQSRIIEIITERNVETQDELCALLCAEGFRATQATVSRDIKQLKLVKIPDSGGKSRYAPGKRMTKDTQERLFVYLSEVEAVFDYAVNTVVVKSIPGTAQALCAMIDRQMTEIPIVGTLAGDDTIFILMRSEEDARKLCEYYSVNL